MTPRRLCVWFFIHLHVFLEAPKNILPTVNMNGVTAAPFWVRWPVGLWVVLFFRRAPEQWLALADQFDLSDQSNVQGVVVRDGLVRELRASAEEADPGIQRRLWQERHDREAEFALLGPHYDHDPSDRAEEL